MPSSLARGPITTRIITELMEEGFPVGDNSSPEGFYGWSGEPNGEDSTFVPYMTTAALAGQNQAVMGMGDTGTEWRLPYTVFYAGLSRKQCEALADRVRARLTNIEREDIASEFGVWRIQKISCISVGASVKQGSAFPDHFTQVDTYEVWISKRRS